MIGSTSPTSRPALHRRHLPRRRLRRRGQPMRAPSRPPSPSRKARSTLEFFLEANLDGAGHRSTKRHRHPDDAAARPVRASKVRTLRITIYDRNSIHTFARDRASVSCCWRSCHPGLFCRCRLDIFRLNLVGKYLTYGFVASVLSCAGATPAILSLGQGVFFGLGGYCMAMFLKLEASDPGSDKDPVHPGHSRFHGLEPDH